MPRDDVRKAYGDRLRLRVGAILPDDPESPHALLLVEHGGLYDDRPFWTMPGGEVQFGEPLQEALEREVDEETGLTVEVGRLLYTLDFVRPPLHAVSFYFLCRSASGTPEAGSDPELASEDQLIRSVRFVPLDQLPQLRIYPEDFARILAEDAKSGFTQHPQHLGTRR